MRTPTIETSYDALRAARSCPSVQARYDVEMAGSYERRRQPAAPGIGLLLVGRAICLFFGQIFIVKNLGNASVNWLTHKQVALG